MKIISAICSLCILIGLTARADDSDDTLRFYVKKSDIIVSGAVVSEPKGLVDESGIINWVCTFKVAETLHGSKPDAEMIDVNIVRFEIDAKDKPSYLKKDAEHTVQECRQGETARKPPISGSIQPPDDERSIKKLAIKQADYDLLQGSRCRYAYESTLCFCFQPEMRATLQ